MLMSSQGQSWIDFLPLVLIVFAAVVVMLAGRGKMLICPNCGNVFPPPYMDLKRHGIGWTFPRLGVVKCPKCGQTRPRKDYLKGPPISQATT
jgi:hypothetical protein